jgi:hypothetical protein
MSRQSLRDERPGSLRMPFFALPPAVTSPAGKPIRLSSAKSWKVFRHNGRLYIRWVDNSGGN